MRRGFTLIELIFVIVILGVMAKFGVELLYKMYENYIYSNTQNRLANQSELALKQIANRLHYRIKDLTVARVTSAGGVIPVGDANNAALTNATVLEWVGIDSDGWRNTGTPLWSGFVDLRAAGTSNVSLVSPGSLGAGNGAVFFIGSNVDIGTDADWVNAVTPVTVGAGVVTGNFAGQDVYEFYQFSRSAYAVELLNRQLILYSNYQPWNGGAMANGQVLMEDVTTFQFRSLGDSLMIQVCVSDDGVSGLGEYSVCKEKVVF